jgi:hypothetical protein
MKWSALADAEADAVHSGRGNSPPSAKSDPASHCCSAGCTSPAPAPPLVAAVPLTFIAFDLLRQASRSLLRSPYAQRRALLDGLGLAADNISEAQAAEARREVASLSKILLQDGTESRCSVANGM